MRHRSVCAVTHRTCGGGRTQFTRFICDPAMPSSVMSPTRHYPLMGWMNAWTRFLVASRNEWTIRLVLNDDLLMNISVRLALYNDYTFVVRQVRRYQTQASFEATHSWQLAKSTRYQNIYLSESRPDSSSLHQLFPVTPTLASCSAPVGLWHRFPWGFCW